MNLGIRNANNLFTLLNQAIAAPRHTREPGLHKHLKPGCAEVTVWHAQGVDEFGAAENEHWEGVVASDDERRIVLDINGTEYTWLKSDRITIKYGDGDAA